MCVEKFFTPIIGAGFSFKKYLIVLFTNLRIRVIGTSSKRECFIGTDNSPRGLYIATREIERLTRVVQKDYECANISECCGAYIFPDSLDAYTRANAIAFHVTHIQHKPTRFQKRIFGYSRCSKKSPLIAHGEITEKNKRTNYEHNDEYREKTTFCRLYTSHTCDFIIAYTRNLYFLRNMNETRKTFFCNFKNMRVCFIRISR